jgi:hypothetical protein
MLKSNSAWAMLAILAGVSAGFGRLRPYKGAKSNNFTAWFSYHGTNQTALSFNKTINYTYVGTERPVCSGTGYLCAIQVTATVNGGILSSGGTFGSPLGTNIAASLSINGIYFAEGADGEFVEVVNKN